MFKEILLGYERTTLCLSIQLLMDIWGGSTFGLLCAMMPCIISYFLFLFYVFVIFLNLGVELLGHMGTLSFSFKGQVFRVVLR